MNHSHSTRCIIAICLCALVVSASAQGYPAKPIRIVVPFPPGGGADNVARVYAQKLSQTTGKQVIIDNRGGASGAIGEEIVARSPADGYTLLHGATSHGVNPALRSLPYDTLKDFAPITLIAVNPLLLLVRPSLPVNTVQDLISLARAQPGFLTFGSSGVGSAQHMAGELLKYNAKINITHVPYKGGAPALADLIGGHLQLYFSNTASGLVFVRDGRLKGIAVASAKRSQLAPEFPTFAEAGVPGILVSEWNGLFAPAGTPKEIITLLNTEIIKILNSPDVKERYVQMGAEIETSSPAELDEYVRGEIARWTKLTKAVGIKFE